MNGARKGLGLSGRKLSLVGLVAVLAFAGLGVFASAAWADPSQVVGGPHDLSSGSGENVCGSCHLPHNAQGAYLWARTPHTVDGDSSSALKPLCYSCHDGTVSAVGQFSAFDLNKQNHETEPTAGADCDRCHEPHDNGKTHFLRSIVTTSEGETAAIIPGGNVCASCHAVGGPGATHPIDVVPSPDKMPIDAIFDPDSTPVDEGTRLFAPDGTAVSTDPTAQLKCETCHSPHGAVGEELTTMGNDESVLCTNCHKPG